MTAELQQAIAGLYETFARYPQPSSIYVCPCCTKADAVAPFIHTPLRSLRFEDLSDFAFSAMTTQGSADDFRYLLPRLFESVAEEPLACDPEVLFGKLSYAKWADWPSDEIAVIKSYMRVLWKQALTVFPLHDTMPAFCEIKTFLSSIAQTESDLTPYLEVWKDTHVESADRHLIQFVSWHGHSFANGGKLDFGFWEKSQTQAETVRRWLLHPGTIERIRRSAHFPEDEGFEHLFPSALAILQREAGFQ